MPSANQQWLTKSTQLGNEHGYASAAYAEALSRYGDPLSLPRSAGWLLRRPIGDSGLYDAMGPYPLSCCKQWSMLGADLDALNGSLVSVTLVTDPFGDWTENQLQDVFPDRCLRFKEHYVAELESSTPWASAHHRYYARKSLRGIDVSVPGRPIEHLREWCELYANLVRHHRIEGMAQFSEESFAAQLDVPGLLMIRAQHEGSVVGMHLWYVADTVAYHHLSAFSPVGYRTRVAYGLMWYALSHLYDIGVRLADLGGAAGLGSDGNDGLSKFKRGWAKATKPVYLCGRVLDPDSYAKLSASRRVQRGADVYFPRYRSGEFGGSAS